MMPSAPRPRILIVDDHTVVRKGLEWLIENAGDMVVIGECGSASEARRLARELIPDLALIDLRLPDGDGISLVAALKAELPKLRTIIITAYPSPSLAESALREGADGLLLKTIDGTGILEAMRQTLAGHPYIDPAFSPYITAGYRRTAIALSDMDRNLLGLLARGQTNKEIGAELGLHEKTVRNRLSELFKRIGVGNRTEAALFEVGIFVPGSKDK